MKRSSAPLTLITPAAPRPCSTREATRAGSDGASPLVSAVSV